MTIRPLRPDDSMTELTQVVRSAYKRFADLGFRYLGTHQCEKVTMWRSSRGKCLVVEESDRMHGTVIIKNDEEDFSPDWYRPDNVRVITQFAVLPEFRSKGTNYVASS